MKTNFKRLFTLLLTLCMLASLMVPVAFAEDEAVATPSVYAAETYKIRVKDLADTDPANPTDTVNALFVDDSGAFLASYNPSKLESKVSGFYDTYGWKYFADYKGFSYRLNQMYMARLSYGGWAALQINVSDAGLYALNLKTDKTVDNETENTPWTNASSAWTGNVSAYIIPLAVVDDAVSKATATETETATVVAINGLMTEEYSVGTVNMAADVDNITFTKTRMEAGEYVVVVTDNKATENFAISEMSLLTTAADAAQYELKEVVNYPIRLVDPTAIPTTEPGTWFLKNGAYNSTYMSSVADKIAAAYDAGDMNWKFVASNTTADGDLRYRIDVNMMLRTKKNELTALQIKVPNSGNYSLTIASDRTASYDTGLTYGLTEYPTYTAYIVNVNDLEADVTTDNIAALAVDANSVGSVELAEGVTSGVFNRTYLEAGEYVLIFTHNKSTAAVASFGLAQRAYEIMPEDEEQVTEDITYKFDLYNNERYAPVFTTPETGATNNRTFTALALTGLDGVYEAGATFGDILLNDYNNDVINWKLYDKGTMSVLTFEPGDTGLRIRNNASSGANQYAAFCLNVPATAMYTVDVVGAYNDADVNVYVYDADAEGNVAANMTDANLAGSLANTTALAFSKILTAGENIVVFEIIGTDKNETFKLNSIVLSVNTDPSSISFDLSTNEAYKAALAASVSGAEEITYTWGSSANMNKFGSYVDANDKAVRPYSVLATMFRNGEIDWALDYAVNTNADEPLKAIHPYEGSMRLRMKEDGTGYTGIRLRIKNAGLYNVTVNAYSEGDPITAYLFPAGTAYTSFSDCVDLSSYMTVANKLGVAADKNSPITASFNAEAAGEYILVLTSNNNVFLSSMDLEPVFAAAYADGVAYESLDEALEKATESVVLCKNATIDTLVIKGGVTLDLAGYKLFATKIDSTAGGANIIDSTDGNGLIRGDIEFNESNDQLPLFDISAEGYRLFNVDVISCATTGSGNSTNYWFKVKFANNDALNMITSTTEMRIKVDMTGTYAKDHELAGQAFTLEATADAAFTTAWAAKNTSYIVVSSVGSSNVDNFNLFPAVTANGVTISGSALTKG